MLYEYKDVSVSQLLILFCNPATEMGRGALGVGEDKSADPYGPKGYSIPYGIPYRVVSNAHHLFCMCTYIYNIYIYTHSQNYDTFFIFLCLS